MKRIRALPDPTPGLADYLDAVDHANWEEFRSHNAGTSHRELRDTLARNQHGLCAYCEIELRESRRQIEHVIPRSDEMVGNQGTLDVANMVACCMGGTTKPGGNDAGDHHREPIRDNMSCGQAKGNRHDNAFIDPRDLPAVPSLTRVRDNGLIEVDERACQDADFMPDHVTRTIEILNLNAERLRLARERWRDALVDKSQHVADDADRMNEWIRALLTPDADDGLPRFFTTARCYFGPVAERILDEPPRRWI